MWGRGVLYGMYVEFNWEVKACEGRGPGLHPLSALILRADMTTSILERGKNQEYFIKCVFYIPSVLRKL
jgi:hypothetical protein